MTLFGLSCFLKQGSIEFGLKLKSGIYKPAKQGGDSHSMASGRERSGNEAERKHVDVTSVK